MQHASRDFHLLCERPDGTITSVHRWQAEPTRLEVEQQVKKIDGGEAFYWLAAYGGCAFRQIGKKEPAGTPGGQTSV